MSIRSAVRRVIAPALLLICAGSASAGTLTADAASGDLSARAVFQAQGSNLVITLSNTSLLDVVVPMDVLTGVFFHITGPTVTLARVSVVLDAGSTVLNVGSQPAGGVVGGEFAYREAIAGPKGSDRGVSSSGLDLFGPGDLFPGPNLHGPASPNGLEYGITSAGDNPATNNGGTNTPLIKSAVVITLSGLPSGFDPESRITNVSFQYGTSLSEPNIEVPAPGSAALIGLGVLLAARRRRRNSVA